MRNQLEMNMATILVVPTVNLLLLQTGVPYLRHLVDFLFVFWDLFIFMGVVALGIALSIGVIFSAHPVRSLFSLIGVFMCAIFMLLSIRVEFLSMIFLIVYIGAIAILFLFVIMLLNLKQVTPIAPTRGWRDWRNPLIFLILSERSYVFLSSALYINSYYNSRKLADGPSSALFELNQINYYFRYGLSDAAIFSDLLYSTYGFLFLTTACLLTIAMIGAIVLALSASKNRI